MKKKLVMVHVSTDYYLDMLLPEDATVDDVRKALKAEGYDVGAAHVTCTQADPSETIDDVNPDDVPEYGDLLQFTTASTHFDNLEGIMSKRYGKGQEPGALRGASTEDSKSGQEDAEDIEAGTDEDIDEDGDFDPEDDDETFDAFDDDDDSPIDVVGMLRHVMSKELADTGTATVRQAEDGLRIEISVE